MTRGRKPLAAEVKAATGAYKKDPQRENSAAPKANGEEPSMPDYFDSHAKSKWAELVEDLRRNGILSSDIREMMVAYCTAYSGWRRAMAKVQKTGLAIEGFDKNGNKQIAKNNYVSEMHKFRDQMNRLLPEFGLTPASRQKCVSMNDKKQDDPFQKWMDRMGSG